MYYYLVDCVVSLVTFTNFKINVLPLTTTLVDFLVYPIEFYVGFIP